MILGEGEKLLFSGKARYKRSDIQVNALYPGTLTMTDRRLVFEPDRQYPWAGGEISLADIGEVREEKAFIGLQIGWSIITASGQLHRFDSGLRDIFVSMLRIARSPGGLERLYQVEYSKLKDPAKEIRALGFIPVLYYLRQGRFLRGLALLFLELLTWWTILIPVYIDYHEEMNVAKEITAWNRRVLEGHA